MNEVPQDLTRTVVLDGDLTGIRNATRCAGAHQLGHRGGSWADSSRRARLPTKPLHSLNTGIGHILMFYEK